MHESITRERVLQAVQDFIEHGDFPGFCLACGAEAANCEPDARGYECECCGAPAVTGAETIFFTHFA